MSIASVQMCAHLRHRGLVFWSFFVPVVFYIPIVTTFTLRGRPDTAISLLGLLALAGATGFFLASAQQELLSRATYFLMPSLVRGMARNQVGGGLAVGLAALAAAFVVPGLRSVVVGDPAAALSVACLAVLVFALVLLLVFQFVYSSWLPFQLMWIQIFFIKPASRVPEAKVALLLDQTLLLAVAAGLAVFLVGQQVRSRALHRRVAQRPFISLADVKNQDRMADFKHKRNRHRTESDTGPRPMAGVIQAGMRQVAAARARGRPTWALAVEATLLAIMSGLPRTGWKVAAWGLILPLFMVMGGYFDARNAVMGTDLQAWFVGLPFMAVVHFAQIGLYLRHPAPGRLWDRGTRRKALWPALGLMTLCGTVACAVLFAFGHLAAALLPPVPWGGHDLFMVAPRWDVFGVVLFTLPLQLTIWAFWRNPRCRSVMQQAGTFVFFIYHGLTRLMGGAEGLQIGAGVTMVCLLVLPWAWSWRVGRTDQA